MARQLFGIEKGFRLFGENVDTSRDIIFGAANPGGDAGDQDLASLGSLYLQDNGSMHVKIANAGAAADWERQARTSEVNAQTFKKLKAATGEAVLAGARNLTLSPFTDDDAPFMIATDFVVGDKIMVGVGGTESLLEVTAVASPSITLAAATPALATNDNFVVENYLPDIGDAQEKQALIQFNGIETVKLGDINWNLSDGIGLPVGYNSTVNGTITNADNVNSALQKLDANQKDLTTLSGEAQGAVNHATFTGVTILDNRNTHLALQDLETALELLTASPQTKLVGVTTVQTLDSVLVDNVLSSEWEIHMQEVANPTSIKVNKLIVTHNGHALGDATLTDESVFAKLKLGANFNATVSVDLTGIGVAQVMRLRVSSTTLGVTFSARRTDVTG